MQRFWFLALALLLTGTVPVLAAVDETVALTEVVAALEGPFKAGAPAGAAIRDFEAKLFQESNIVSLNRIQRAEGQVNLKFDGSRGGQAPAALFRWEYVKPSPQEFVSDGKTLYAYLPENRQVIQSEIAADGPRPDDPITFLTGLGNLSRDFTIGWAEPNRDAEGNFILELSPRRESPMLKTLRVVVDRNAVSPANQKKSAGAPFPLLSSTIFDPNGNTTRIEFKDVRVNLGLPDSLFKFVVPEGVEVLRPSANGSGF